MSLHAGGPPEVRRWLEEPAKMRIIGSAYDPANDANYSQTVDSWRDGFDAIIHLNNVASSRLLEPACP